MENLISFDSKAQFIEYYSELQANNLATKLPTIIFENKNIQKLFDEMLQKNKFLWKMQKLEKDLFKYGKLAIGFYLPNINRMKIPEIKIAQVQDYKYEFFELSELELFEKEFSKNYENYKQYKKYSLNSKLNYIPLVTKKQIAEKEIITASDELNNLPFIPWTIFKNRPDMRSDIELVHQSWFDTLDGNCTAYAMDTYLSAPFVLIKERPGASVLANSIRESIFKLDKRVFTINDYATTIDNVDEPIKILQAQSQSNALLQTINADIARIEKFIFGKTDTLKFGTKNLQTAEVENANSDNVDFYEYKANLRESDLTEFIELWYKFMKHHKLITEPLGNFEVIVTSSTKWLQNEAKKYEVDFNEPTTERLQE